ncbi:MAG: hypothetical protein ACR2LQ_13445 [Acidimicrobiales bacterium]
MTIRRWRRRVLRSSAVLGVAAVLVTLAACSSGGSDKSSSSSSSGFSASVGTPGPAASVPVGDPAKEIVAVDGLVVSEKSFNDELNAIGSVPSYLDATDLQLTPSNIATRLPQGGFDPGYVRLLLRRRVLLAVVEHELAVRNVPVSDTCTQAATAHLAEALSGDLDEGNAFLAAFPQSYRDQLIVWNAEVRELQAQLSGLACDTADPSAQDKIGTAYATWLDATLATANIAIEPSYGIWDASSGTILPPGGLAVTTTPRTGSSASGG